MSSMLKTLGTLLFGSAKNQLQIDHGQLYELEPSKPTAHQRVMRFRDASLQVRKTSQPFHFQLVVTRVYEEGEDELNAEDTDPLEDEVALLIHESIMFRRVETGPNQLSFVWVDTQCNERVRGYELVVDSSNDSRVVTLFERMVYACMYERLHKMECKKDEDIETFIKQMQIIASTVNLFPDAEAEVDPETPHVKTQVGHQDVENDSGFLTPVEIKEEILNRLAKKTPIGEAFGEGKGQLYIFDPTVPAFCPVQGREEVILRVVNTDGYKSVLEVVVTEQDGEKQTFLTQDVDETMQARFHEQYQSICWVYSDEEGNPIHSFSVGFNTDKDFKEVQFAVSRALYESQTKDAFNKLKGVDQEFLIGELRQDIDRMDLDGAQESSEEDDKEETGRKAIYGSSKVASDDEEEVNDLPRGTKNSQLTVSYNHPRSYVMRGNNVAVFKHDQYDDGLEKVATIKNIKTSHGQSLSPSKVLLHDRDRAMLFLHRNDPQNIYKMDIEYGKVVEEWKVDDYIQVSDILPSSKYAQRTGEETLVGFSHNALFRIDPRLSGNKLATGEMKQYAKSFGFTAGTSNEKGQVALANDKGEIRLYSDLNKVAKTQFPGFGAPILSVDVTADGKWVVATTKTYLILLNVEVKDAKKGDVVTGFDKKSSPNDRHAPIRLQLKPEDVARLGVPVSFTPAKFNTVQSLNEQESNIVTSTGKFVVTWNMRHIKQGKLSSYRMAEHQDKVVADNFMFGQSRSIIVALPEHVEIVNAKAMTPTKRLGTPGRRPRASVVNEYY